MPPRAKRVLGGPAKVISVTPVKASSPLSQPPVTDVITALSPTPEPDVIESVEIHSSTGTPEPSKEPVIDSEIICPICSEKMISLSQLNRHLDDEHGFGAEPIGSPSPKQPAIQGNGTSSSLMSALGSPQNEELRSWLKKTNEVKSKIQAQLPKKLARQLEMFDSSVLNGALSPDSRTSSNSSIAGTVSSPEIQVTRKHWQKPTVHDTCHFAGCQKPLNIKNGIINCRRCGYLFCHQHTNYRTKLNAEAHYDAMGTWCRCCEDCFMNKPGYNEFGAYVELTTTFQEARQKKVDERQLYQNKLEKRVINLTTMLNQIDREFQSSEFNNNFLNFKINSRKRQVEQQLVNWEDGAHILNCFLCLRNFNFTLRKHHCRLCGKVVCGDLESGCSMEVPINHLTTLLDVPRVHDTSEIRICRHCKSVLFLKRNFQLDTKKPLSPLLEKFETQQNIKKAILVLMPRFQDMLQRLQSDQNKTKSITQDVSKLRKRLVDSFALFDRLTKEIVGLECSSRDEAQLQMAIKTESATFIQQNMAPLKQLPKLLAKIEEETKKSLPTPKFTREEVQKIKRNRDELMVLQEQKYLVEDMIETCKKQRRFDEITALNDNLKELERGIAQLQLDLGDEGF